MKHLVYEIKGNPTYSGCYDTDCDLFATSSYAHEAFIDYNERFFNNALHEIPFCFVDSFFADHWLGLVDYSYFDNKTHMEIDECDVTTLKNGDVSIVPCTMYLVDSDWASRFHFENVLLHEMCHLYQVQVLCKGDLKSYDDERKTAKDTEHGDFFHKAARLVNESSLNKEEVFNYR